MYSNIMLPSDVKTDFPDKSSNELYASVMDAITQGTKNGLDIFLNVNCDVNRCNGFSFSC